MGFSMVSITGAEAARLATEQQSDFAVLNVMMPGLNGPEVARNLCRISDAAIFMLTARGDVDD
jgi:DNA-binding response OmpR family regulator